SRYPSDDNASTQTCAFHNRVFRQVRSMQAAWKSDIPGIADRRSEKLAGNQFLIATCAPPCQKAGVVPSLRISACAHPFVTARKVFVKGASNFWRMDLVKR
ncbi:MAG: hypothetical protein WBE53_21180, partial [Pseudolabrys sp.]